MNTENILSNPPDFDYTEKACAPHSQEFGEIVRSRRSVRRYENTSIPDAVVREVLQWGLLAPNSSNLQPWEFYWIRNPDIRKSLNDAFMGQSAVTTAPTLILAVARTKTWKRNRQLMLENFAKHQAERKIPKSAWMYYEKLVPMVYSVGPFSLLAYLRSALFCLVGFFRPVPREPGSLGELRTWAVKTTALACENIMLGFSAHGYDTCPMEGMDSTRVKKILKLSRDAVVVMGISAGKRAPQGIFGPQVRFDSKLFIHEV